MRLSFFALLVGVLAASPRVAPAQSMSDDPSALLRDGVALRRDGRNEEALETLRRAAELAPSGQVLTEMGYAARALGRWLDAENHLTEALQYARERWVRHHRREILTAIDDVRAHLGRLRVTSNVDGADVQINGVSMGRTPLREPLRLGTGRVTVTLHRTGFQSASREVTVDALTDAEAHVSLERDVSIAPVEPPPPPPQCPPGLILRDGLCFTPPPPPTTGVTAPRVLMYGGGAVALATAAAALGLWVDGNRDESEYLAACGGRAVPASCEARFHSTQSALDDRATTVTALWVVSGVALVTGITGLLLELKPWQRRSHTDGSRFTLAPNSLRVHW